jgi:hypothetical protein
MRENDRLKHLLKSKEEASIDKTMILPPSEGYAIQDRLLSISKALGSSLTNRTRQHYQIHSELVLIVDQLIGRFKYLEPKRESTTRFRSLSNDSRHITKPNPKPIPKSNSRPSSLSLSQSNTNIKSVPKPKSKPKPNNTNRYVPLKSEPLHKGNTRV